MLKRTLLLLVRYPFCDFPSPFTGLVLIESAVKTTDLGQDEQKASIQKSYEFGVDNINTLTFGTLSITSTACRIMRHG